MNKYMMWTMDTALLETGWETTTYFVQCGIVRTATY